MKGREYNQHRKRTRKHATAYIDEADSDSPEAEIDDSRLQEALNPNHLDDQIGGQPPIMAKAVNVEQWSGGCQA